MRLKATLLAWLFPALVFAAPVLRLSNSVVLVQVGVGANAPGQAIEANNIGDGSLSLTASVAPGSPWLKAVTVGTPGVCAQARSAPPCTPIQFTFDTPGLARGAYTASVTVSDPNAEDAPQVVTVTAQVGGPPPYTVDHYMAPGQTYVVENIGAECSFCPQLVLPSIKATTQDGGQWLQVSTFSQGTFGFRTGFLSVLLAPPAAMTPGTYTGSLTDATGDVTPVTMRLTNVPIAAPSVDWIGLRLAEGGPPMTAPFLPPIALSNTGTGTLAVEGVSAQGAAVSAYRSLESAVVTVDPGTLPPGTYNDGSVTFQCNGANCPIQVPVRLEIVPRGKPLIYFQQVADNGTFSSIYGLAPGDIAIVKGEQLSLVPPAFASSVPLPTSLGGTTVLVNDVEAPLYYSSSGQVAFQVPSGTTTGTALVQIVRDGQISNTVTASVARQAPVIVVVTDAAYRILDATHPAHRGDTVILWCIGLGATNPPVADGAATPAGPPALVTAVPQVYGLGFPNLTPTFAGLAPGAVGLYQVNVAIPPGAPMGVTRVGLVFPVSANSVPIAIQ